jgi:predicted GNAT family N-acyltransferase
MVRVFQVDVGRLIDLRHRILRADLPVETAHFDGDELPTTRHFAAIDPLGQLVGCCTLMRNPRNNQNAWQLRGMAVETSHQKTGVGAALLEAVDLYVHYNWTTFMWCNARVPAKSFYEKHGWTVVSDVFDIPTAGPHVVMEKRAGGG